MSTIKTRYDVVILGAGHNGLVAASYLGRAGLSVLLLEKNNYVGGATTSQKVFPEKIWDTMLEPLIAKEEFRRRFDADDVSREAWRSLVEEPLGTAIERYLKNDLVRGLVFTDAKIGVLTDPHDTSLLQNRCFIYHLIGNKTGEWKVPVGGMGAVVRELEQAARK